MRWRNRVIILIWNTLTASQKNQKRRKQNIIWFNPPFSTSVSINVEKTFLKLVTKHLPRSHKLHKIFSHNTVKVSYSCMNNMSEIIMGHNQKVTSKLRDHRPKCDCKKRRMSGGGELSSNDVVYKFDVTRPLTKKVYPGLAEGEWESSFYSHKLSFKHNRYSNKTTFSS